MTSQETQEIITFIKNYYTKINIKALLKVGSSLFYDNPGDLDFIGISDDLLYATREKIMYGNKKLDVLLLNEEEYAKKLDFNIHAWGHGLYNYQLPLSTEFFIEEGYDLPQFDMLNMETKRKYIKGIIDNYPLTLGLSIQKHYFVKAYVHYYIILEIYKNNKIEITEEMQDNINKLRRKEEGYIDLVNTVHEEIMELSL